MALSPMTLLVLQEKSLSSSIPFEFMCVREMVFFKLCFMENFKFIQTLYNESSYTPHPALTVVLSPVPLSGSAASSVCSFFLAAPGSLWDLSSPGSRQ